MVSNQTTGNIGLYYVCYRLSKVGWNVMPTTRNARGIDILAYSSDASQTITAQVKSLSRRSPVPLGKTLDHLFAEFVIVCRLEADQPQCFILIPVEVKKLAHCGNKNGNESFWLQPKAYEQFRDRWDRIPSNL
jgi:hypothetical protein